MTVKDILVAFDGRPCAHAALQAGVRLAGDFAAHLTGCAPRPPFAGVGRTESVPGFALPTEVQEITARIARDAREAAERAFRGAAGDVLPAERLHWLDLRGEADLALTKAARHFDMTLIGTDSENGPGHGAEVHPDVIALRSGRPVLVVPEGAPDCPLGRRVVVAWDGKRAAARTVGAAVRLLGSLTRATILTVGPPDPARDGWGVQLCTNLRRHGIDAEHVTVPVQRSVGRTLLKACADRDADLLIMGAYEHSKFSEDILGGTTNEILAHLECPVFLAH